MENKNVFILSVGRRVELVKLFQRAKNELKVDGIIIGGDMDLNAPAMQYVDRGYKLPKISSEDYINEIIRISKEQKINLIIPTIDTELLKLAQNKERIEKETGAILNLSNLEFIEICRDKYNTQYFFEKNGFGVPRLIKEESLKNKDYIFPLFIKPLNGSSSINTFKINNEKELQFFKEYVPNPIIQECITGEEFTVDVFCDFECKPITIVPRKRLATRSGEISKGEVVKDREIIEDVKKLLSVFKAKGHITVQCMKTKDGIKYIEINPRFGGGAPMSIMAGADSPKYLYEILLGKKLEYNEDYEDGLLSLRYDEAVFISKDGSVKKNV
ncbi:MAG: ATP-grasp domain-containing protein [Fusobacteriaceae bacterium]